MSESMIDYGEYLITKSYEPIRDKGIAIGDKGQMYNPYSSICPIWSVYIIL